MWVFHPLPPVYSAQLLDTYLKRSFHKKDLTAENNCTLEPRVQGGIDAPFHLLVGLMKRDQFDPQQQIFDTLYRPAVVNVQCIIGSKMFPDAWKKFNYDVEKKSQDHKLKGKVSHVSDN